jgi:hypothetical protein
MSQADTAEPVLNLNLYSEDLTEDDMATLIALIGEEEILAITDGKTLKEWVRLSEAEERRVRQEAATAIAAIPALQSEWVDFREGKNFTKITRADLYSRALQGHESIRSLDFALKNLIAILRDQRVPKEYKGMQGDREPRAVRLAIGAVYKAKEQEFQENLRKVPGLIQNFLEARKKGRTGNMEDAINQLAAPYFKRPLAKHLGIKVSDLKHFFDRLEMDLDAVKKAQ